MKVQILQGGTYSKFNIPGYRHRVYKQQLAADDVIDYPDWYAEEIIASGRAVAYAEPAPLQEQLIDATNAAFRLAGELDVDLLALTGSGSGGRITVGDVRKARLQQPRGQAAQ